MFQEGDTIAAIATAPGEGAVSIVRISGPRALLIADEVFRCKSPRPSERSGGTFVFGRVVDESGSMLDEALLLIMRAPHSYTREDTVEIQGHGGTVNARRILERVIDAGARVAGPGEFTRRAFLNGRLDLVQAEAVADIIRAKTERAALAAVQQLEGRLSMTLHEVYEQLLYCSAQVEAALDFADQELPKDILYPIHNQLFISISKMRSLLETWREGRILRDGATVVIAGKPNVGKSTLLNALVGAERAIVSPHPGTTRDTIRETVILEGYPVTFVDTAGIRPTSCEIELEGIRRAEDERAAADLCLYVIDASLGMDDDDRAAIESIPESKRIVVWNKIDRVPIPPVDRYSGSSVHISARTGAGLDRLKTVLVERLVGGTVELAPHSVISTRHRQLLQVAVERSETALQEMNRSEPALDLAATNLREATESLGAITGRVYYDDLLDSIFSRFCIGK